MSLIVKICGLATRETLDVALDAAADMVGFVFFPSSPRHLTFEAARDLGQAVKRRALKVALTVDADDATLQAIVEALQPDLLQLHGRESLARLRDIKWLFSHAGGTIPMLAGRIDAFYQRAATAGGFAPNGVMAELRRLHYDTANATSAPSMAALTKLVPATQITFGSDYPYFPLSQIETLRNMDFRSEDLRAIECGNAARLIPRLNS